jgi:hypothetical protein
LNKVWSNKPCSKILWYPRTINFQNENPIGNVDIHIFAFSFTLVGVCLSPKIFYQLASLLCFNLGQKPKAKVAKRINLITLHWRKHSFSSTNWPHFLPKLLGGRTCEAKFPREMKNWAHVFPKEMFDYISLMKTSKEVAIL